MEHLKQDKEYNCSETCLAMISGKDVRDIENIEHCGKNDGMDLGHFISICQILNISIAKDWGYFRGIFHRFKKLLFPWNCFVYIKFEGLESGHLIVRRNGKFYDPNGKQYYIPPKRYYLCAYLKFQMN